MFERPDTPTTKEDERARAVLTRDADIRLVLLEAANLIEPSTGLSRSTMPGRAPRRVTPSRREEPAIGRRPPEPTWPPPRERSGAQG